MNLSALYLGLGGVSGGTAVALGALGAHALRARLDSSALATFETAVQYHFLHSIALCVVALWLRGSAAAAAPAGVATAGAAFLVGILLFSGSLYALAFGGPRWLGPITPLGGLAFILGWACLAWEGFRRVAS